MGKGLKKRRGMTFTLAVLSLLVLVSLFWILFSPSIQPWLKTLTRESRRILGLEKDRIPEAEKRIREEIIVKRMEDPMLYHDWRSDAPEYPRPRKMEGMPERERIKILKETPEFKEMEKELKDYLKKKESLFQPEPPLPSLKEAGDLVPTKDRGTEKVIERLLSARDKDSTEKPLEENVSLGIKGPLASRKIVERPVPPHVKVKVEAEIELTFWVVPNGMVDRVVSSVRGDAELEQIAIQYLKQWRFAPLPKDHPQVEQWGTIPMKFKLQ